MLERLLQRSKISLRIDDNISIFEKRFEGYLQDSLPVVQHLKNFNVKLIVVSCNDRRMLMQELNVIDIFSRKR